ncbi:FliA/WhiG family RNA polymerase sigma factor [bacterium]|nr:FliA/WhiG family RNA polymerase sigma factor [bacterium]
MKEPEQPIKDELVLRYLPLVEQVAGRMKIGLPDSVQVQELINSGIIGLIGSIDNFDLGRGFKFETYAVNRIRGSILDSLRDYDWMPRSLRTKAKNLEAALVKLEGNLGRVPSDEEIAEELEIGLDDYYGMLDEVKVTSILSLDQPLSGPEGEVSSLGEMLEDDEAEDVPGVVEWNDAKRIARRMIEQLSQQERLVIALYYYEELTLREIGEVLSISESRVSQIHSRIILTLKGKLRLLFGDSDET